MSHVDQINDGGHADGPCQIALPKDVDAPAGHREAESFPHALERIGAKTGRHAFDEVGEAVFEIRVPQGDRVRIVAVPTQGWLRNFKVQVLEDGKELIDRFPRDIEVIIGDPNGAVGAEVKSARREERRQALPLRTGLIKPLNARRSIDIGVLAVIADDQIPGPLRLGNEPGGVEGIVAGAYYDQISFGSAHDWPPNNPAVRCVTGSPNASQAASPAMRPRGVRCSRPC